MPDKKFIATMGAHRTLTMNELHRSFDAVMYPQMSGQVELASNESRHLGNDRTSCFLSVLAFDVRF